MPVPASASRERRRSAAGSADHGALGAAARRACSASSAALRPPTRAATRIARPGAAASRSTVWVPTLPVLPRTVTVRAAVCDLSLPQHYATSEARAPAAAATGAAVSRPSTRSSRPPWPGMSRPESFTPKWRLISALQQIAGLGDRRRAPASDRRRAPGGAGRRQRGDRQPADGSRRAGRRPRRTRSCPGEIAGASRGPPISRPTR